MSLKILSSIPIALADIVRMIMILLRKYRDSPTLLRKFSKFSTICVIELYLYQIVTVILIEVFGSVSPLSSRVSDFWSRRRLKTRTSGYLDF